MEALKFLDKSTMHEAWFFSQDKEYILTTEDGEVNFSAKEAANLYLMRCVFNRSRYFKIHPDQVTQWRQLVAPIKR